MTSHLRVDNSQKKCVVKVPSAVLIEKKLRPRKLAVYTQQKFLGTLVTFSIHIFSRITDWQEAQRASYRAHEYNVPSFWRICQGGYFCLLIGQNAQTRYRTLRSCFLPSFVEIRSAVLEKKSKKYQPIRGRGGHLVFRSVRKTQTGQERWYLAYCPGFIEFQ